MEIEKAIAKFGTEAVLEYRAISSGLDNSMPEVFLGGFISSRLYNEFHCPVHIERHYLTVARELKVAITKEMVENVGGYRADLALYPSGGPPAIVEFKIFDEGRGLPGVLADVAKMKKLAEICPVSIHIGLLICQTNVPAEENAQKIGRELGRPVSVGEMQRSADDRWNWCFGCASF